MLNDQLSAPNKEFATRDLKPAINEVLEEHLEVTV